MKFFAITEEERGQHWESAQIFFIRCSSTKSFVRIFFPLHKLPNLLFGGMTEPPGPPLPEEIWGKGSFAVRLISVVLITLLDAVQYTHYCVMGQQFCGSCQRESFFFPWWTSMPSWQILWKERNSNYPGVYFPLDKSMGWQRNVRAEWQELKRVITRSANYPTIGQREKYGSSKRSPWKMQLWSTGNCGQKSLCPNSEILKQCDCFRQRTAVTPPIRPIEINLRVTGTKNIGIMSCMVPCMDPHEGNLDTVWEMAPPFTPVKAAQWRMKPKKKNPLNFLSMKKFTQIFHIVWPLERYLYSPSRLSKYYWTEGFTLRWWNSSFCRGCGAQ